MTTTTMSTKTTPAISDLRIVNGMYIWEQFNGYSTSTMRTNGNGEGLFRKSAFGENWTQCTGTCQFSLAGKSMATARQYLRRMVARQQ